MKLKALKKAQPIIDEIQGIDNYIKDIDAIAKLVAGGDSKSTFSLKVEELKKPEDEKVKFDEDGSLIQGEQQKGGHVMDHPMLGKVLIMPMGSNPFEQGPGKCTVEITDESVKVLDNELTENATLRILSVLLSEKHNQREALVWKLKTMGFEID